MATPRQIEAGRAIVRIGAEDKELRDKLQQVQTHLNRTASAMQRIGAASAGVGAAIVGPLALAAASAAAYGDSLNDLATKTGIAVRDLASLGYAAEQSGATMDTLEIAVKKMQDTIANAANGNAEASKSLAQLGVTADSLRSLAPDEQFRVLGDAIAGITDPAQKTAAALNIFGKSGTDMLPLFSDGAKGLKAMEDRARELGIVMGAEAAASVGEFDDALNEASQQIRALKNTVGAAIAEALLPYRDSVAEALKGAIEWARENKSLIVTVAGLGAGLLAVGSATLAAGAAIPLLIKAYTSLTGALIAAKAALSGVGASMNALDVQGKLFPLIARNVVMLTAALAALGVAYAVIDANSPKYTESLRDQARASMESNDAVRASQKGAIDRLAELNSRTRLTSDEMRESDGILETLSKTYGNLGVSIDKTTGRLTGFADAQNRVSDAIRESAIADVGASLAEARRNLRDIERNLDENRRRGVTLSSLVGSGPTANKVRDDLRSQRSSALDKIAELERRLESLQGGGADVKTGVGVAAPKANQTLRGSVEDVTAREKAIRQLTDLENALELDRTKGTQREIMEAERASNARVAAIYEVIQAEELRNQKLGGEPDLSVIRQAEALLDQIGPAFDAEVAAINKRAADEAMARDLERYDLLQRQEIELAKLRGDKAKELALTQEQYLRDQEQQFKQAGLTGPDLERARANARDIADAMGRQQQGPNRLAGQVFSAQSLRFASTSTNIQRPLEQLNKKAGEQLTVLQQLLARFGLSQILTLGPA